jgi:hypothetical protein
LLLKPFVKYLQRQIASDSSSSIKLIALFELVANHASKFCLVDAEGLDLKILGIIKGLKSEEERFVLARFLSRVKGCNSHSTLVSYI